MIPKRVAFISGGSRGLGRSMALVLAEAGIEVAFTYLGNTTAARQTVRDIRKHGVRSLAIKADVRDHSEVRQAVKSSQTLFGRIDILVNNVGAFKQISFEHLTPEDWNEMIASNLNSVFYCCQCIGAIMRTQRYGRVINIGLANANYVHAYKEVIPYAIAKTGVLILTKSLAAEWAEYGITVNAISPGLMDNGSISERRAREWREKVPMDRLGTGADISAALQYLISDAAEYVTGTEIIVSGGWGL